MRKKNRRPFQSSLFLALYRFALSSWGISLSIVIYAIWRHLNFLQIDHAGHIASASSFSEGLFHHFNDRFFLGYVQNLFYPPLEDLLLSVFGTLLNGQMIVAYKIYLSLLILGFSFSFYTLSLQIKSLLTRSVFLFAVLFVMWIDKPQLLDFQGLSFVDLLVTGLSSQFLGGIFFVYFVTEMISRQRLLLLVLWCSLTIGSHLVMGLAVLTIGLIYAVIQRSRTIFFSVAISLGLSGYFLVPFLLYGDQITSAKIFRTHPDWFFWLGLAGAALSIRVRKILPLFLASSMLLFPLVFGPRIEAWGWSLPVFHYYRFGVVALFLLILSFALLVDEAEGLWRKSLSGLFLLVLFLSFNLKSIPLRSNEFRSPVINFSNYRPSAQAYGRDWIIEHDRSFGFGIDSVLALHDPSFRTMKGLFWESSRSNTVLSSYLATLLSPPVVLDYFYYYGYTCDLQQCLMDRLFQDYNITRLFFPESGAPRSARSDRQACYRRILSTAKTKDYQLTKNGSIQVNDETFYAFELRSPSQKNQTVEVIGFDRVLAYPADRSVKPYELVMRRRFDQCRSGDDRQVVLMDPGSLVHLQAQVPLVLTSALGNQAPIDFVKKQDGVFQINTPNDRDQLFWIKLSYFPGVRLINANGQNLPLFAAFPGMIAYGKGEMTLRYDRPFGMRMGYLISALSTIILLTMGWRSRAARPLFRRER